MSFVNAPHPGHVDIPRDSTSISGFTENIKKVDVFLKKLKEKHEKPEKDEFVAVCLKELYKIIMTVGKIVLHHPPPPYG